MPNSPHSLRHYGTYEIEIACECIATVVHFLKRRSKAWPNGIPEFAINKVLAILQALLKSASCERLVVVPAEFGPQAEVEYLGLLAGPGKRLPIKAIKTRHFFLKEVSNDWVVDVTEHFIESYKQGTLHLQNRQNSVLPLEAHLAALVPILDEAEHGQHLKDLLTCWSICATGRLGLDYVMHDLHLSLSDIKEPIEVLIGGRPLRAELLRRSSSKAKRKVGVASAKLQDLSKEWHSPVTTRWKDPIVAERELLSTIIAPHGASLLFSLAGALCKCIERISQMLDDVSGSLETQPVTSDLFSSDKTAWDAEKAIASVRREYAKLRLFGAHVEPDFPSSKANDPSALARELDRLVDCIYGFASAFAMGYRMPVISSDQNRPGKNRATQKAILMIDMGGSTRHGAEMDHETNLSWQTSGLNLLAQWGRAFGGNEHWSRDGDDVVLEFDHANSALLCACFIQEHLAALRSTGIRQSSYHFRIGIDVHPLTHLEAGNVFSAGISIAKKLAKHNQKDDDANGILDRIWLTPSSCDFLSEQLSALVKEDPSSSFEVAETPKGRFFPSTPDRGQVLLAYLEILGASPGSQ